MNDGIHQGLIERRREGPGFLWLVDPDRLRDRPVDPRWRRAGELGVTAFLVGASSGYDAEAERQIERLRGETELPIVLFPGSAEQINPHVDAILFMSLVSGRNPDYLIGEQVAGAPRVRELGIEPIPTGYILVGTSAPRTVERVSQTKAIPADDLDRIGDTALAASFLGMKLIYLEAGSGAGRPLPVDVIARVRSTVDGLLFVGGGLVTPEDMSAAVGAGADYVVVGTALEQDDSAELLAASVAAVCGQSVRQVH